MKAASLKVLSYTIVSTDSGWIGIAWSPLGIRATTFPMQSKKLASLEIRGKAPGAVLEISLPKAFSQLAKLLNDNYLDIYEDDSINITSIADLANYLHDRKLFGYLTNSTIKTLCKICLHTKFIHTNINQYPKLYFEEEGWDKIHFLEFYPGTETIIWGSYAFDFNVKELEKSLSSLISILAK